MRRTPTTTNSNAGAVTVSEPPENESVPAPSTGGGGGPRVVLVSISTGGAAAGTTNSRKRRRTDNDDAAAAHDSSQQEEEESESLDPDGPCKFIPEERDPWIQGEYSDEDDDLTAFMGLPEPPNKCFGCQYLNPAAMKHRKTLPLIERTRLDQLNLNLNATIGLAGLNQQCINISREYTENIMQPTNKHLRPGQKPLPAWNPATIKMHLTRHTKNPIFRMQKTLDELQNIRDLAYKSAPQYHPVKRQRTGKHQTRVDKDQWKIYKETVELEHKLTFSNLSSMTNNWEELRVYAQKNGSDFIDISQKNVFYHLDQTHQH